MSNWKGDSAASARAISKAQADLYDKQRNLKSAGTRLSIPAKVQTAKIEKPVRKKAKGQLSIFRNPVIGTMHNVECVYMTLALKHTFITVHVGLEDFSKALTGLGVPMDLEVLKESK